MDKNFLSQPIEQHHGTDRESFALMGSCFEINLEAVDLFVTKCRGADWAAFAARLVTEYIPSRQQLPAVLSQGFGFSISESVLCRLIPDHNPPITIHCISGFAGTENVLSGYQSFATVISPE